MQLSTEVTDHRFPFLKKGMKAPKIPRHKLQEEFAYKGWETSLKTESGKREHHIVFSPTKYYQPSFKHNVPEKKKPMLVEISNIESVFKENKLNSFKKVISKPPQNCHNFVQKLYKEKHNLNNEHKRSDSKSFNLQELEAAFQVKKYASDCSQDIFSQTKDLNKHKNLQENLFKNYSDAKQTNKISDSGVSIQDAGSPLSVKCPEVVHVPLSSYGGNKGDNLNTVPKNNNYKGYNSELYDRSEPQVTFQVKTNREESLRTSNYAAFNSVSNSNINEKKLCSYNSNKCKNIPEAFMRNFADKNCSNQSSIAVNNIDNEHSIIIPTKAKGTTLPCLENKCNSNVPDSHYKRLSSDLSNLQDIQSSSLIENVYCDKLSRTTNQATYISGSSSSVLNSCKMEPSFNNSKRYEKLPEKFLNSFLGKKCGNKNSDINIESEHSPTKSIEVIHSNLPSSENDSLKTVSKSSHHKRLGSEVFNFHDFEESFQVNEKYQIPLRSLDNAASLIEENSPIKSTGERKVYLSSLKKFKKGSEIFKISKFSENFARNTFNGKCENKNSDIGIEDEHSPIIRTDIICSKLPSFESDFMLSKNNCHKRLSSEAFNLEESVQITKKCHESLRYPDYSVNLSNDKSTSDMNVYLSDINKFSKVSETLTTIPVNEECVNKNSDSSVSIQDENSPEYVKSAEILSLFISSFEDGKKSLNSVSKDEFPSEEKHLVFNNKTFIKTLQLSFQEKSSTDEKGSNWVQSLNWDNHSQSEDTNVEYDKIEKKLVKNVIHGGFAEQMLKVQRRERSDQVIWNHKINELKKKAEDKSVCFTLTSFLHFGQIIVTKCTLESNKNVKDIMCNGNLEEASHSNNGLSAHNGLLNISSCDVLQHVKANVFIVLFKKNMFLKLRLRVGDMFILYPPWQVLSGNSSSFPVILCTYFVDPVHKSQEVIKSEIPRATSYPVFYSSVNKYSKCEEPVFSNTTLFDISDLYGKSVCISARIQRIWKTGIVSSKVQDILNMNDYLSFTLLLQTKDNVFLELKIDSGELPDSYHEFLSEAEGKCYKFCDIVMSHRYNLKKSPNLASITQSIQNQTKNYRELKSLFCYQFIPVSFNKIPYNISDQDFPAYCDYEVKPLSFLQKNNFIGARFSCIGKILLQDKNEFYISDESLLNSKQKKYCKLKFSSLRILKQAAIGTTILVKEAAADRDCIIVDQFSNYEVLSNATATFSLYESRLKKIDLISFKHILSPLTLSSKVKELVLIKGTISEVDENTAMSWLECSYCFNENLLEDSNSIIYCEDCSCIVPKPVLKVKMEVTVISIFSSPAKLKIQLLSSTVKKILNISEDNYQPQCNISDVLEKNTGDLCCYIKSIETIDKLKVFHLTEITRS